MKWVWQIAVRFLPTPSQKKALVLGVKKMMLKGFSPTARNIDKFVDGEYDDDIMPIVNEYNGHAALKALENIYLTVQLILKIRRMYGKEEKEGASCRSRCISNW